MQYCVDKAPADLQLDPSSINRDAPHLLRMAQSIAAETENTRAELRDDSIFGLSIPQPPLPDRGFIPAADELRRPNVLLADLLPWPALLTLRNCADNAARRAGCTQKEIFDFSISICPYEHIVTLLNYIGNVRGISDAAKILSPLIRGLKVKETRIKQGASVGGKKSARTRLMQSNVPQSAKLLQERQRLLERGVEATGVAGILAQRYGVDASTIRRRLRKAAKSQAE